MVRHRDRRIFSPTMAMNAPKDRRKEETKMEISVRSSIRVERAFHTGASGQLGLVGMDNQPHIFLPDQVAKDPGGCLVFVEEEHYFEATERVMAPVFALEREDVLEDIGG